MQVPHPDTRTHHTRPSDWVRICSSHACFDLDYIIRGPNIDKMYQAVSSSAIPSSGLLKIPVNCESFPEFGRSRDTVHSFGVNERNARIALERNL